MNFLKLIQPTPTYYLGEEANNQIYIKRDDLLPFSYGGNKLRKAALFFEDLQKADSDYVVTYGSASSNHCRIVANMAASIGIKCVIISTEKGEETLSRLLCKQFGSETVVVPVERVHTTIEKVMQDLHSRGCRPYFIQGGGHGNLGTRAYDLAYDEIKNDEESLGLTFPYIFHASGTGTTQAGLICGKLRHHDDFRKIVGISIARANPYGGQVISDSVSDYIGHCASADVIFSDAYRCGGYGKYDPFVEKTIDRVMTRYGVPLDPTYTGKAFCGMLRYLTEHEICGRNILFLHTGGTPLYHDWMVRR